VKINCYNSGVHGNSEYRLMLVAKSKESDTGLSKQSNVIIKPRVSAECKKLHEGV
jgi:hypothetical protein